MIHIKWIQELIIRFWFNLNCYRYRYWLLLRRRAYCWYLRRDRCVSWWVLLCLSWRWWAPGIRIGPQPFHCLVLHSLRKLLPKLSFRFTSEFEYLDSAYEIQVFPQPKAPGMAQVPPSTDGNRESSTLCPVKRGTFPASFSATGRTCLTGQYWLIWMFWVLPSYSSFAMVSPMV